MKRMFTSQSLEVEFYDGVDKDDPRIAGRPLDHNTQRCWSIMYGHLDMLKMFAESADNKEYGIFCEDDILIRKDFAVHLPTILSHFIYFGLNVLLLGCLCSNRDFRKYSNFPERRAPPGPCPFTYYSYNADPESAVWGTQMYMLSRSQARHLISRYADGWADRAIADKSMTPFSADWTITKDGEKAIIYPLVAIENNDGGDYADPGQDECRKKCREIFYSADLFSYS